MSQQDESAGPAGLVSQARESLGAAAEGVSRLGRILDAATSRPGDRPELSGKDEDHE